MTSMPFLRAVRLAACALTVCLAAPAVAATLGETPEIVYSGADAQALADKAAALGTAVGIYEYLHNTIEYSAYHGSRSGSVNTFLGQRGSDVDIASTLIAMLRARNIPARYAVGTVRIPAAQLTNWLGVGSLDVAVQVLKDQGIQGVTLASDRSSVDFEHAWAEAFVPFDQYRGINTVTPAIDCSVAGNASRCTWVALDASFKQKTYNGLGLDPYNAVSFDYTAYYNAIKDNNVALRDKNPLTILEDQIGAWLRTNHPGKTLEDVEDAGEIVELSEGLLPASLPYQVIGTIRRYDTVADHDAAVSSVEPKKWGKALRLVFDWNYVASNGGQIIVSGIGTDNILLADIVTKRLTMSLETQPDGSSRFVLRLGGQEIPNPLAGFISVGQEPPVGTPFTLTVVMDGAPGATAAEADKTISAAYGGIVGGYYLIATGGESSNWSQVHRAAEQLLAANGQYTIVFNPGEAGCLADGTNCTPYVDATGNGWDASDKPLLQDKPALDALTGGLLYVASTQYYAKLREQFERSDRLMKTKTPVIGFLGVVSSVYEAEYIDGTAFSILPGGLLIDMKGIRVGAPNRANEAAVSYSNRQFEFLGHIVSSLEHEIWQELTGYDAVSTVRGIQMALTNGATLLNPKKNTTENTLPALYASFGFTSAAPSGFTYSPYTIFSTTPATWKHTVNNSVFDTFLGTVDLTTSSLRRLYASYYYTSPTGNLYGWSKCVSD
ncbi:MAG: transglutaminase-like domain-containing protein, partial [Planctomycetota bacterium]